MVKNYEHQWSVIQWSVVGNTGFTITVIVCSAGIGKSLLWSMVDNTGFMNTVIVCSAGIEKSLLWSMAGWYCPTRGLM